MDVRTTAPARTVAAVLAETWLLAAHLATVGVVLPANRPDQLLAGAELPLRVRLAGPVAVRGTLRCEQADERGIALVASAPGWQAALSAWVDDGVLRCELHGAVGPRGQRFGAAWPAGVAARAEQLSDAPKVVGAAIIADGAVLAAQRSYPPALAGRWEFPGGRVEPGEREQDAVVRECQEELGATVRVTGRVGPDLILPSGWVLRIHAARLVDGQRPDALEHHALRWVRAAGLAELDWLDADRAVLPALHGLL
ncbi:MAG TPA: (deoxy)nucleoside triphosphate pyrophosphohydrolase [Pseudonocardiaceae bacterium]|nr:(deoxy)nucleoside triphosphate pyrophosphohydrolase [Pseudonocardiaceae bacterium]